MMRAWALAACLLTLSSAPALAQTPAPAPATAPARPPAPGKSPAWGVEGGFSMSRISPDGPGESITRGPGGIGGLWFSVQPWVPIGIQVEALYAQRHTHLTDNTDLKLDYFEVPILAKLKLFKSIYMLEGVAFSIPVNAKVSAPSGETDVKSTTRSPEIALVMTGGVPVTKRLSAEFRYEGAFTQVSTLTVGAVHRSRSLSGMLRIKL